MKINGEKWKKRSIEEIKRIKEEEKKKKDLSWLERKEN